MKIGESPVVAIGVVVMRDVSADARVSGPFAIDDEGLRSFLWTVR